MPKKLAVIFDGGFIAKIFEKSCSRTLQPKDVIAIADKVQLSSHEEEIFRVYYYNAPPFDKILTNPITGAQLDYAQGAVTKKMTQFHRELSEMEYVALRLGELRPGGWTLPQAVIDGIRNGSITGINRVHLKPVFRQKAVDMKIGLDIALLAIKKIVDRIALVTADTDFIPVMKFARKEGLQVIIVQIGPQLVHELKEHADQVRMLDLAQFK